MKIEIYKSGYTQWWIVLVNGWYRGGFQTEEEAKKYIEKIYQK